MREASTVAETPEAIALAEVHSTDHALAAATEKLQAFVRENFRVTPGGLIYQSDRRRDSLDAELQRLLVAVDKCRTNFHAALRVWSAMKKS
jgi:hypothetical protein